MKGWYMVAFARNVAEDLTAANIGPHRLILVREAGRLRAFNATCPHRGANLARGGRLHEGSIVCPFHGYRIQLGDIGPGLCVSEHPVLDIGGMIFVRLSSGNDNGWVRYLECLENENLIINGFEMSVRAPMETVTENAFDRRHFRAVHGVETTDFVVETTEYGGLIVESVFYLPTSETRAEKASVILVPYRALVVSPGLVAVELGGPAPYTVITGATDMPTGGCDIRLSLALPKTAPKTGWQAGYYDSLLQHSRRGLEEDRTIWENLSPLIQPHWMPDDHASRKFFNFCEQHRDG
jgi:nitrite reductase/ring-hydroxylating ferredoxin subunit